MERQKAKSEPGKVWVGCWEKSLCRAGGTQVTKEMGKPLAQAGRAMAENNRFVFLTAEQS